MERTRTAQSRAHLSKLCEARGDLYPHMFTAVSLLLGPAVCSGLCRLVMPGCELSGEHNEPATGACRVVSLHLGAAVSYSPNYWTNAV